MRRSYQPTTSTPPPLPPHIQQDLSSHAPPFYDYTRSDSPSGTPPRYSTDDVHNDMMFRGTPASSRTSLPPMMGGYQSRQSMSDVALTGQMNMSSEAYTRANGGRYSAIHDDDEEQSPIFREKPSRTRRCFDKACCGCMTCCPRWARYCSCVCLLLLLAVGITIGVLAALFKVPQVSVSGMDSQPSVNVSNANVNLGFQLQISVNNPNVEGITFDTIVAKAYYPGHSNIQLGGGEKDNVHIAKQGLTNFTFPFNLAIQMNSPQYQSIVDDLFNRCGLYGSPQQPITINYDVIPTIKIGVIPISFTISNHAQFDCPDILAHGGAGGSANTTSISL